MNEVAVLMDKELFDAADAEGKANFRSAGQQLNLWAKVGRNALANPDLPITFIYDTLIAKEQPKEIFEFEE